MHDCLDLLSWSLFWHITEASSPYPQNETPVKMLELIANPRAVQRSYFQPPGSFLLLKKFRWLTLITGQRMLEARCCSLQIPGGRLTMQLRLWYPAVVTCTHPPRTQVLWADLLGWQGQRLQHLCRCQVGGASIWGCGLAQTPSWGSPALYRFKCFRGIYYLKENFCYKGKHITHYLFIHLIVLYIGFIK